MGERKRGDHGHYDLRGWSSIIGIAQSNKRLKMNNTRIHIHYPISAQTIPIVATTSWKDEIIKVVEKMITEINEPYDGSLQLQLQLSRKITSLNPYKTVKIKEAPDG
jgi:hypothetical protein